MPSPGKAPRLAHRLLTRWLTAYDAESRRRLVRSVTAVPRALAAVPAALRRPHRVRAVGRALLALPVAVAGSALTGTLAFLLLINVLGYPFRPWLGLGHGGRDIWTGYADSWGGPTLAGAWLTHAAGLLLLVVPPVVWAVRGLTTLQRRLTDEPAAATRVTTRRTGAGRSGVAATRVLPPAARPLSTGPVPGRLRRTGAVLAASGLLVAFSLTAHVNGIGDNLLWVPRDVASSLALAVTLTPVAALLLLRRTTWWAAAARS
ncbi:hypothetical protein [Micromonospora auratinigra]|nr:hypothetical protein [Micromonospora auratinigra]